jgi:hypothetical protein
MELTANPNADALCLMNETAREKRERKRERGRERINECLRNKIQRILTAKVMITATSV